MASDRSHQQPSAAANAATEVCEYRPNEIASFHA
jgi:hypothetical protein